MFNPKNPWLLQPYRNGRQDTPSIAGCCLGRRLVKSWSQGWCPDVAPWSRVVGPSGEANG